MKKYSDDILEEARHLIKSLDEWLDNDFPVEELDPDIEDKHKKDDDYEFNPIYNDAMKNRYYDTGNVYVGDSFWFFQQNINELYLYYQYLRRFINFYTREALKFYKHQQLITEATYELPPSYDFYDYEEEIETTENIYQIEYENIIMALYRVFERFLKEYIKECDPNTPVLQEAKDDHTVVKYMNYLKEQRIFIPSSLYREFNKIRLLRNHLVHSNDTISGYLQFLLTSDRNNVYQEGKIIINNDFIESSFKTICGIVKCIDKYEHAKYE